MTVEEAVARLLTGVPRSATWRRAAGEAYGPQHTTGSQPVRRALYCVTVTPEVEQFFGTRQYDLLVAHHPFRPTAAIPNIVLHTALDCCAGGLNDLWRDALEMEHARPITDNLGWSGRIRPASFQHLVERVHAFAGGIDGQCSCRKDRIESVAVCSGLGGLVAQDAVATGADLFVTGQLIQPAARLDCPAVIEMGHTRSERVGVITIRRLLGRHVQVDVAPLERDYFAGEVFRGARAA
jgi:putative NIF3 family GTP cyclohydrolase 1 type 2